MSSSNLKAETRERVGSRHARSLRAEGRIPASLQGGAGEHLDISIDASEFWTARRKHVHLFDLEIGGNTESATVRELQWDPIAESIDHIEFMRVTRGVAMDVEVDLEFLGHPKGGVLNHLHSSLEVKCLPSQIPDSIEVQVGELETGDVLTAADITLPEGFELLTDPSTAIVNVVDAAGEIEDEPAEDADEGAADVPTLEEEAAEDESDEPKNED